MGQMIVGGGSPTDAPVLKVEAELEVIFGGSGKQVLVREFAERYGLSVSDALTRPAAFKSALFYLLGDLGSHMVMGRINKRVWGTADPMQTR